MKRCGECGAEKPLDQFHKRADGPGYRSACKTCWGATLKRWVGDNREKMRGYYRKAAHKRRTATPEKVREINRKWRNSPQGQDAYLRKTYGITLEDRTLMLEAQNGLCPGCRKDIRSEPCVDHDHATGRVRGLLCSLCNLAAGNAKDLPQTLRNLAEYLEKHRAVPEITLRAA